MKSDSAWTLVAGQIWNTGVANIEILRMGKRWIHYRITKELGERRISAQISAIEAMESYLRNTGAKLVASDPA